MTLRPFAWYNVFMALPKPAREMGLEDRLKASVKNASRAADMNPAAYAPPPKEEEPVPDLREVIVSPAERLKAARLIDTYAMYAAQEKEAKAGKEVASRQLKSILGKNNVGKCQHGEYRINYFSMPRSSIKMDLLLSQGVAPAVIAKATEITTTYQLRITAKAASAEEES